MIINGIMMKSVRSFRQGQEKYYQATVYMDEKKIGFYSEDPALARAFCFDRGKDVKGEFEQRVCEYFNRYEVLDEKKLEEMTLAEYNRYDGRWPVIKVEWQGGVTGKNNAQTSQDAICTEQMFQQFLNHLLLLQICELEYKKAVRKGYRSILWIHFLQLRDVKKKPDVIYYISDEKRADCSAMEYAVRMYGEKPFPAIVLEYSHVDDFVIL